MYVADTKAATGQILPRTRGLDERFPRVAESKESSEFMA